MENKYCVISSNCISGFWYKDIMKCKYEVPFIWSNIKLTDFIYLIKNFNTINFNKIKVAFSENEFLNNEGNKHLKVVVDDKISVYFTHYKQSQNAMEKPIIEGYNVVSSDIKKYAEDVWMNRVNRMSNNKKKVWVFWDDLPCTNTNLNEFIDLGEQFPNDIFILITTKSLRSENKNVYIVKKKSYKTNEHLVDIEQILNNFEN